MLLVRLQFDVQKVVTEFVAKFSYDLLNESILSDLVKDLVECEVDRFDVDVFNDRHLLNEPQAKQVESLAMKMDKLTIRTSRARDYLLDMDYMKATFTQSDGTVRYSEWWTFIMEHFESARFDIANLNWGIVDNYKAGTSGRAESTAEFLRKVSAVPARDWLPNKSLPLSNIRLHHLCKEVDQKFQFSSIHFETNVLESVIRDAVFDGHSERMEAAIQHAESLLSVIQTILLAKYTALGEKAPAELGYVQPLILLFLKEIAAQIRSNYELYDGQSSLYSLALSVEVRMPGSDKPKVLDAAGSPDIVAHHRTGTGFNTRDQAELKAPFRTDGLFHTGGAAAKEQTLFQQLALRYATSNGRRLIVTCDTPVSELQSESVKSTVFAEQEDPNEAVGDAEHVGTKPSILQNVLEPPLPPPPPELVGQGVSPCSAVAPTAPLLQAAPEQVQALSAPPPPPPLPPAAEAAATASFASAAPAPPVPIGSGREDDTHTGKETGGHISEEGSFSLLFDGFVCAYGIMLPRTDGIDRCTISNREHRPRMIALFCIAWASGKIKTEHVLQLIRASKETPFPQHEDQHDAETEVATTAGLIERLGLDDDDALSMLSDSDGGVDSDYEVNGTIQPGNATDVRRSVRPTERRAAGTTTQTTQGGAGGGAGGTKRAVGGSAQSESGADKENAAASHSNTGKAAVRYGLPLTQAVVRYAKLVGDHERELAYPIQRWAQEF